MCIRTDRAAQRRWDCASLGRLCQPGGDYARLGATVPVCGDCASLWRLCQPGATVPAWGDCASLGATHGSPRRPPVRLRRSGGRPRAAVKDHGCSQGAGAGGRRGGQPVLTRRCRGRTHRALPWQRASRSAAPNLAALALLPPARLPLVTGGHILLGQDRESREEAMTAAYSAGRPAVRPTYCPGQVAGSLGRPRAVPRVQ